MQSFIIIVLAVAIGVLIWGCTRMRTVKDTRTLNLDQIAGSGLRVVTANGAVNVRKASRTNISVVATVRARTRERLNRTLIAAKRDSTGVLSVSVAWPDGTRKGNEGCAFEIELPDANGVKIETSNGAINISGLQGAADLRTSNGRIEAYDQGGPVTASTSNGRVMLLRPAGEARVRTSNGRIEVVDATGPVAAETSNGAVSLRLANASAGPVQARTSNGAISLTVGAAFAGEIDAQTSNGLCSLTGLDDAQIISQGKSALRVRIGDSVQVSRLRTSNGSITVGNAGVE